MAKKEFTSYGSGHNPERGIRAYQTPSGETLKFTKDGQTMSLYDRDPADHDHSGVHITDNGDGTYTIKTHGPDGDKGGPPSTGRW